MQPNLHHDYEDIEGKKFCTAKFHLPDDADVEFRIVVIAIELISSVSGDHILNIDNLRKMFAKN